MDISEIRERWDLQDRPVVGSKLDAVRGDLFEALGEIERLRARIALAADLARDYAEAEQYLKRPMKAIREALSGGEE